MAAARPGRAGSIERPLSPHLQIYAPVINMMMSILHRITGGALYVGTVLLAAWLVAAASGPDAYSTISGLFGTVLGKLVLLGYTWALLHHMMGGIRHLIWDTGRGYEPATIDLLCWGSLVLSLGLTVAIWVVAALLRGGL